MINIKQLSLDQKRSHLRNLASLAMKDGKLAQNEKRLLEMLAREWGLSQKDASIIGAKPDELTFVIPDDRDVRFRILYDFVEMMIIDGEMKIVEKQICEAMTERLGLPQTAVRTIIDGILDGNRMQTDSDEIRERLRRKLVQ